MSEHRQPEEVWIKRLPQNEGKKTAKNCKQKIELFPAHYWALDWEPGSKLFYPKPPLKSGARKEFWDTYYRVRVNGVWLSLVGMKYEFFTKMSIAVMLMVDAPTNNTGLALTRQAGNKHQLQEQGELLP